MRFYILILFTLLISSCSYNRVAYVTLGTVVDTPGLERHLSITKYDHPIQGESCKKYGVGGDAAPVESVGDAITNASSTTPYDAFWKLQVERTFWFPIIYIKRCYTVSGTAATFR